MKNKSKVFFTILIVVAIVLIGKFVAKPIKNTFHLIFAPAEKTFFEAAETATGFVGGLINAKQIEAQNQQLLKEHFVLVGEKNALQKIKEENVILRQSLGISEGREFEFATAEVISKQIISDMALINKGRRDGFQEGMIVITPEFILVGKIAEVTQNFSQVALISAQGNSFDIKINNDEKSILGAAKGIGNFEISYGLIPKDETIKMGDKIFTVALGGNFPDGFLVGEVTAVKRTDAAPYQTGLITPYFNRIPLKDILIIKNFTPVTP